MKYLLSLAAAMVFAAGCSSPEPTNKADQSWKADYSKWGKNPVSGGLILKKSAGAHREYEGVKYYFHDEAEAQAFDANPSGYLTAEPSKSGEEGTHLTNVKSK